MWNMPSSHLAVAVSAAILPSGQESTLVLYLYNSIWTEVDWREGISLTTVAIAIWTGTMSQPNIPSKGKINYRYKGSEEGVVSS